MSADDYGILKYFEYGHLPEELQQVSRRFHRLAYQMAALPSNAETAAGLRKLLEAKDCQVRAALSLEQPQEPPEEPQEPPEEPQEPPEEPQEPPEEPPSGAIQLLPQMPGGGWNDAFTALFRGRERPDGWDFIGGEYVGWTREAKSSRGYPEDAHRAHPVWHGRVPDAFAVQLELRISGEVPRGDHWSSFLTIAPADWDTRSVSEARDGSLSWYGPMRTSYEAGQFRWPHDRWLLLRFESRGNEFLISVDGDRVLEGTWTRGFPNGLERMHAGLYSHVGMSSQEIRNRNVMLIAL